MTCDDMDHVVVMGSNCQIAEEEHLHGCAFCSADRYQRGIKMCRKL